MNNLMAAKGGLHAPWTLCAQPRSKFRGSNRKLENLQDAEPDPHLQCPNQVHKGTIVSDLSYYLYVFIPKGIW